MKTIRELVPLPSKEFHSRLSRGLIKLNNEVVSDSKVMVDVEGEGIDLGEFLCTLPHIPKCFPTLDIKDFFGEGESNMSHLIDLSGCDLVSFSKREHLVYKRNKNK